MAKQLNVNLGFTADTSQAAAQIQNLQNQLTSLLNSTNGSMSFGSKVVGDVNKASKAIAELKMHLKNATNVNTGTLDFTKLNESIGKSGMTLQQYGDKLRSLGPAGQQAFNALANSVAQSEIPIRRSNAALTEMWTTLKNTARWQISSSILHGFMGSISAAVGYAKDLNKSLNDIRIVTGASVDEMARFAEQANRSAKALSASTTEYTKASLIYYQQGLDDQAVKERTDVTIKMANVSGQTAEMVSDQMTAVWNNFAKGNEDLERFADVMVRLGADTASSSDEIATGLEKFASIGDMVGLSFDNAAAALATVTATTRQSADIVGTAFKTIFARIQGLKLGETLEDGTDLNKYSEALATVGISIKEQNGELKDMDNILAEMGAKWQTLSKDQQVALAQTVAGVRQYNQLVALMDNFDFYEQNLDSAKMADGSLQEQADIYAESWQAASARVKAATQGIYEDLLDDEAFIDVLNIIEKILTYIDNLIDGLGGLGGVLTTVGALLTRAFSSQIAQSMTGIVNGIKMMTAAGREQAQQQKAQFMKDSADAMRNMSDGSNEGNMRATMMEDQLRLQTSMIENSERMSAEEQQINQMLLDRQRILSDNAIVAAKELDAAIEAKSDATMEARTDIASARINRDDSVTTANQAKSIKQLNAEFTALQTKMKSTIKIRADFKELSKILEEGRKSSEILNIIKEKAKELNNVRLNGVVNALKEADLEGENFEITMAKLDATMDRINAPNVLNMSDMGIRPETIEQLIGSMEREVAANEKVEQATNEANAARDRTQASINGSAGAQKTWADQMVAGANVVMSLMSALQALNGIIDVATNPDMSGWEKFLSIGSSLAMMFVMLAPLLQGTNLQFLTMASTSIAGALGVKTFSAAEMEAAISGNMAAAGTATFATALWTLLWPIGLVMAAIAALVLVVGGLIKLFKSFDEGEKLKKLEEEAQNASEAFDRTKEKINETKTALDSLESGYETIEKLKEGTLEWYEAIGNVNAEVMKLVETYPELAQYISSDNGVLKINQQGQDWLDSEMNTRYATAANNVMSTKIREKEKKYEIGKSNYIINNGSKWWTDPEGGLDGKYEHSTQLMEQMYVAPQIEEMLFTTAGAQGYALLDKRDNIADSVNYTLGEDYNKYSQEARDKFIDSLGQIDWKNTDAIAKTANEIFGENFKAVDFSDLSEELLYQRDNMEEFLAANKDHIKEQKELQDSIKKLQDTQFESVLSSMGSTRTADEGKELLGGRTYEDIKAETKTSVEETVNKGGMGGWQDHKNYTGNEKWIQDFMKQMGASDYVAQRGGEMVLKIDDEEQSFSRDEVINTLTDMYSTGAAQEEIKQALIPNIQEAYNIATEGLTAEQLVNLDEMARGIKEGMSLGFEGSEEELNQKVNEMTQGIGKAYGSDTEALAADTSHINFDDVEIQRKIAGLTQQLNEGTISAEEFRIAIKEIDAVGELDSLSGVFEDAAAAMGGSKDEIAQNAAEMQNYAKHLMEVSKESDELSDELATNADSAADLAVEVTRMNKGVDKLADGIEDWSSILKKSNKTSQEYAQAIGEMRGALADVLDVNADLISNDFMVDPGNLALIEEAAKGSGEAIDALRAKMDEELILNITAGQTDEFIAKVNELDGVVQDLAANLPDIEVGAILDDAGFLEAANNLVQQSGMTADEANAYFAGIGYEPVYNSEEIPDATSMESPNVSTTMTVKSLGFSEEPISIMGKEIGFLKAPQMTIETESTPLEPTNNPADMRLTSFSGGTTPPKIRGMRKKASGGMNNYSKSNSGGKSPGSSGGNKGGKGGKGGGGGDKAKKPTKAKTVDPTEKKDKDEEIERYQEITEVIDDLNRELDEIGKKKEEAWGPNKLKAMDQELAKLKQLTKAQEQYIGEINGKLAADKAAAAAVGATFDEFGRINNYDEVMGKLVDNWNSTATSLDAREQAYENSVAAVANTEYGEGQESAQWAAEDANDAEKEAIDKARETSDKTYEDGKKAIQQYIETLNLSEEAKTQLEDYMRQIRELNYEKLMYKVEFKVEVNDRELKILEHYAKRLEDDFYKTAEVMAKVQEKTKFYESGDEGILDDLETQLNDLETAFKNGEITQADYIEGLGKIQDMAMDNVDALYEMNSQMREYYADVIDEGISKIQEMTDHFEHLTSKLQHYSSILGLMGHEQNYDLQNNLLQGQIDILNDKIETSKATMAMLDSSLKSAQANYENATSEEDKEYWRERIVQISQALNEEEDAYLSYVEEVGDAANQILTNSIEKAFKEAELSMTNNLGFDSILADMERMNTLTDEFLTNTNKMYETNKMISSAQLAIDKTQNAQAKQKYQDYIKYIEQLQVSGNLTKTELEIAQARYKVLEAEIALEEAKNAKSEVRLTRDSEGNFGYVYTANQDEVASATQSYLDAQNELYNIGLENTKAYREKTIQLQQSTLEELKQLEIDFRVDHIISEEQYNQQKAAILETSNALLETYNEQFQVAQFTMATTSYNALMQEDTNFYNGQLSRNREHTSLMEANDTEYYNGLKTTAETTQQTLEGNLNKFNAGVLSKEDAQYLARTEKDIKYYTSLRDLADGKAKEIDGIFNTNKYSLANKLKNVFYGHLDTALASCQTSTTNWKNQMALLVNEVGVSFDGKDVGLSSKIANTLQESKNLKDYITGKDGLIIGIQQEWDAVESATLKWQEHWSKIQDVIRAYDDLIDRTQTLIRAEAGEIISNPSTPGGGNTGNGGVEAQASALASQAMEIVQKVHKGTIKQDSLGWKNNAKAAGYSDDAITLANGAFNDSKEGGGYSYYYDKALQLVQSYDTGGYTGDWGPEGKLALLHQKELVLNAQDTENLLAATTILREISQMLDTNALIASLGAINLNAMTVSSPADQVLQQEVTIHADFPNVTDHSEIEMAIDNLINAASQYANRK